MAMFLGKCEFCKHDRKSPRCYEVAHSLSTDCLNYEGRVEVKMGRMTAEKFKEYVTSGQALKDAVEKEYMKECYDVDDILNTDALVYVSDVIGEFFFNDADGKGWLCGRTAGEVTFAKRIASLLNGAHQLRAHEDYSTYLWSVYNRSFVGSDEIAELERQALWDFIRKELDRFDDEFGA